MLETKDNEVIFTSGLSAKEFEIPFPYWDVTDITVYLDGVQLKYGINYTLTTYEVAKKIGRFLLYPIPESGFSYNSELIIRRNTEAISKWNPFNYRSLQPEDIVKNFDRVVGMIQDNSIKKNNNLDIFFSSEIVYLTEKSVIDLTRSESRFTKDSLDTAVVSYKVYDAYGNDKTSDYNADMSIINCSAKLDKAGETITVKSIGNKFIKSNIKYIQGNHINESDNIFIVDEYEKANGIVPQQDERTYFTLNTKYKYITPQPEVGDVINGFYIPNSFIPVHGVAPLEQETYYSLNNEYVYSEIQPEVGDDLDGYFIKEYFKQSTGPAVQNQIYFKREGDGTQTNPYSYEIINLNVGDDSSQYYIESDDYIAASGIKEEGDYNDYYYLVETYKFVNPQPEPYSSIEGLFKPNGFKKVEGVSEGNDIYYIKESIYTEVLERPSEGADLSELDYYIPRSFIQIIGPFPEGGHVSFKREGIDYNVQSGLVTLILTNKYNNSIILTKNLIAQIIQSGENYNIEIESNRGTVFRPGESTSMILTAHIFQNGSEIDNSTLNNIKSLISWRRVSYYNYTGSVESDANFNAAHQGYGNVLEINCNDINSRATYYCDLNIAE